MNVHSCISVTGWPDVGPTSANTQSTLSGPCAQLRNDREILFEATRVTLDNNDRIVNSCRVTETSLRGVHDSGQRNKRSRHGSVVLHSCHAAAYKQITGSCRF